MCINKKWIINKYTKKKILVECGKCEACQQHKAQKRTLRINMECRFNVPYDWITLHCTLTYDNNHVPFIREKDYDLFMSGEIPTLSVYRYNDHFQRLSKKRIRVLVDGKKKLVYKYRPLRVYEKIDSFDGYDGRGKSDWLLTNNDTFVNKYLFNIGIPDKGIDLPHLRYVFKRKENGEPIFKYEKPDHSGTPIYKDGKVIDSHYVENGRIGVLYYKDIQNWIKNFRSYLQNHYGITEKFSFFSCGELGPDSFRPHYHVLLHFKKSYLEEFKQAIAETWQFDNLKNPIQFDRQVKLHNRGASYVSSYVNRSAKFPKFFEAFRPFAPSHNYSHGYGMVSTYCKLPYLLECAKKGQFLYERVITKNGVESLVSLPLSSYVIGRFFPKFKGYSRLNDNEVYEFICGIGSISEYCRRCDITYDEYQQIRVRLFNSVRKYCDILHYDFDVGWFAYAHDYISVWNRYYSFLTIYAYENIHSVEELIYHFNNWYEMQDKHDLVSRDLHLCDNLQRDVNKYPQNLAQHDNLCEMFHNYAKVRKVRNMCYSINSNV